MSLFDSASLVVTPNGYKEDKLYAIKPDDGSGDLVMPLPQDLLDGAGWKEGDTLEWIDNNDGTWSLKKLEVTDGK